MTTPWKARTPPRSRSLYTCRMNAAALASQYGLIECGSNSALLPVSFSTSLRNGPTALANIILYAPQK